MVLQNIAMQVEIIDARSLTEAVAREIGQLLATVWPSPEKSAEYRMRQVLEIGQGFTGDDAQAPRFFIFRQQERVIAHSAIISRTIGTSVGDLTIAGLARVCSDPEQRGQGLGELVARAALEVVDSAEFPFSLFQTSVQVRPFYEKLGACLVENTVVNSLGEDPRACPFSDSVIMRYPSSGAWPEGEIDLRGPGY